MIKQHLILSDYRSYLLLLASRTLGVLEATYHFKIRKLKSVQNTYSENPISFTPLQRKQKSKKLQKSVKDGKRFATNILNFKEMQNPFLASL
jgi:hypothetical protein